MTNSDKRGWLYIAAAIVILLGVLYFVHPGIFAGQIGSTSIANGTVNVSASSNPQAPSVTPKYSLVGGVLIAASQIPVGYIPNFANFTQQNLFVISFALTGHGQFLVGNANITSALNSVTGKTYKVANPSLVQVSANLTNESMILNYQQSGGQLMYLQPSATNINLNLNTTALISPYYGCNATNSGSQTTITCTSIAALTNNINNAVNRYVIQCPTAYNVYTVRYTILPFGPDTATLACMKINPIIEGYFLQPPATFTYRLQGYVNYNSNGTPLYLPFDTNGGKTAAFIPNKLAVLLYGASVNPTIGLTGASVPWIFKYSTSFNSSNAGKSIFVSQVNPYFIPQPTTNSTFFIVEGGTNSSGRSLYNYSVVQSQVAKADAYSQKTLGNVSTNLYTNKSTSYFVGTTSTSLVVNLLKANKVLIYPELQIIAPWTSLNLIIPSSSNFSITSISPQKVIIQSGTSSVVKINVKNGGSIAAGGTVNVACVLGGQPTYQTTTSGSSQFSGLGSGSSTSVNVTISSLYNQNNVNTTWNCGAYIASYNSGFQSPIVTFTAIVTGYHTTTTTTISPGGTPTLTIAQNPVSTNTTDIIKATANPTNPLAVDSIQILINGTVVASGNTNVTYAFSSAIAGNYLVTAQDTTNQQYARQQLTVTAGGVGIPWIPIVIIIVIIGAGYFYLVSQSKGGRKSGR